MDGLEATCIIREMQKEKLLNEDIIIIVLTAYGSENDRA